MAVTNTYLDTAVTRLQSMYSEVLATTDPVVKRVVRRVDTGLLLPFLWLFPGAMRPTAQSADLQTQTYAVNARLVVGYATQDTDGALESDLFLLIPTVLNYFSRRKQLQYANGQSQVQYLVPGSSSITLATPFGVFPGSNHLGVQFEHTLSFSVDVERITYTNA